MLAAYDEHEAKVAGPGGYERFQAIIEGLEQRYPR
jgi:hypothetical protein